MGKVPLKPGSPQVKKPSLEKIKARMVECRRTCRLNFSNLNMWEIPPKFLTMAKMVSITAINEINIHKNYFTTLPLDMGDTKNLRVLNLKHNRFADLPRILFTFNKIQVLDASENELKEIDSSLSTLTMLREIDFSKNHLTTMLCFWTNMSSLVNLNISKNKLTTIPASIELCKTLVKLNISENMISSLPPSLGKLNELVEFDCHKNQLTNLPSTVGHLKNIQRLECSANPLAEPGLSIYLQGFDMYMGYLRTIYQEEQLESKAKDRPPPETIGPYQKYYTKSELNNWPVDRTGHSITQANHVIYIFGGFISKYGKVDELYGIHYLTLIWGRPVTNGGPPSCRDGHSAAFDGVNRIFYFGGRNEEHKLMNDLYYIDLRSMSWVKPMVEGTVPAVREGANMVVVDDKVIVFGGRGVRQRYNDIYILDTKSWIWTAQCTQGSKPNPRQHAAMVVENNIIYLHGGRARLIFDDMYVISTTNFIWIKVNQSGLEPRYGHSAKILNGRLYIIGGVSGNGCAKTSLFSMPLTNDDKLEQITSQQAMLLPLVNKMEFIYHEEHKWLELETELTIWPKRTFCFHMESLVVVQNREEAEEQIELEGFSNSYAWDIYMEARLKDLKPKVLPPKKIKAVDIKTTRVLEIMATPSKLLKLPRTFQTLSDQERNLHEHAAKYQKRFMQLYPERRPQLLVAPNECGIDKFICSTIRPSQISYTEFFYWEGPANFLPGYLMYEQLEDPLSYPKYIASPRSILQWAKADCFDYAIVLVSLLLGVGYNAFCVVGYAPKAITTNNQKSDKINKVGIESKPTLALCGSATKSNSVQPSQEDKAKYDLVIEPAYNTQYLLGKQSVRHQLSGQFVEEFLGNFDEVLIRGKTDDQDTVIDYIEHYKPPPRIKKSEPKNLPIMEKKADDPFDKNRVHTWVMVVSGAREVAESFFLEPTTGRQYLLRDSPYQAIEYIWNTSNVWINMQPNVNKDGLTDLCWDLKNINLWEKILDTDIETSHIPGNTMDLSITLVGQRPISPPADKVEPPPGPPPPIIDTKSQTSKSKKENVVVEPIKKLRGDLEAYHWFLGLSWVPKLIIPVDNYVTRCPKGVKKTLFNHCAHIMYSFYGDYMRWDGLVERMLYFGDNQYSELIECHDFFQRRKDMLKKRIYFIKEMKVQEVFGAGTITGIKVITITEGTCRKFEYFPCARIDGLQIRDEIIGKKITEYFGTTESLMFYRCACYAPAPLLIMDEDNIINILGSSRSMDTPILDGTTEGSENSVSGSTVRHGSIASRCESKGGGGGGHKTSQSDRVERKRRGSRSKMRARRGKLQPSVAERLRKLQEKKNISFNTRRRTISERLLSISKITQKYHYGDDVEPIHNIAKKVFKITQEQIRVNFHFLRGRITSNSRIYNKDGSYSTLQVDPFQQTLDLFAQMDEYHHLVQAEKEGIQSIRDAELEISELLQQRAREEQCVVIMTPYSDVAQIKKEEVCQEDIAKVESDYLSPYFPPGVKPRQHLTRPQMLIIRDNCMRALRERLVTRTGIIQQRYEEETSMLAKRRANFERDREGMTVAEEEEYEHYCEEAVFRIRILEERNAYHEVQSLKKYAELNEKLQNDSRLAELYVTFG